MERPSKRMKVAKPEIRNPRTGSKMTEGLFTSELGIRGGNPDHDVLPTRTINLSDFQRRNIFGEYQRVPRPALPRRNAGIYLRPRAPDATVTASVVEINVNDGTSTSKVTEVTAAASATVVSLSNVGSSAVSVTVPGMTATGTSTVASGSTSDLSQDTITAAPTSSSSSTASPFSTTESSSIGSFSDALTNSTTTVSTLSASAEHTVTVTATSTYEISLVNGTVIATESNSVIFTTGTSSFTTTDSSSSSSSESATFTFGDLTSTSSSSSSTSVSPSSTGSSTSYFPGAAGTGATASATSQTGSAASSSSTSGSGSGGGGSPGLSPTQQQVVGGVVGGVAGIALMLAILLVVLRWYRHRLKARGQLPEQISARELASGPGNSYPMSQRSSNVPFAAAVASNLRRFRPHSTHTVATSATGMTDSSVKDSERGFQRIAGRKIAPVLSSGGDPYGGNYGAFEKDGRAGPSDSLRDYVGGLAGASFYRDNAGFYAGKGTHSPTFPSSPTFAGESSSMGEQQQFGSPGPTLPGARDFAAGQNSSQVSLTTPSRPEGYAVMRPSPARTPVTLSPAASSIRLPIQQVPALDESAPPLPTGLMVPTLTQRDGVGRSLASQDGSRISRSSGRSGGRFVENM